jgi:hypothetical protein
MSEHHHTDEGGDPACWAHLFEDEGAEGDVAGEGDDEPGGDAPAGASSADGEGDARRHPPTP